MLAAILQDFAVCSAGRMVTTLDRRLTGDADEMRLGLVGRHPLGRVARARNGFVSETGRPVRGDVRHRSGNGGNSPRTTRASRSGRRPIRRPLGRRDRILFRQACLFRAPGPARPADDSNEIIRPHGGGVHVSISHRDQAPRRRGSQETYLIRNEREFADLRQNARLDIWAGGPGHRATLSRWTQSLSRSDRGQSVEKCGRLSHRPARPQRRRPLSLSRRHNPRVSAGSHRCEHSW